MGDEGNAPIVDTRLLGKPRIYDGNKVAWSQWKYVFKAFIGAVNSQLLTHMISAEETHDEITFERLNEAKQKESRHWLSFSARSCKEHRSRQ